MINNKFSISKIVSISLLVIIFIITISGAIYIFSTNSPHIPSNNMGILNKAQVISKSDLSSSLDSAQGQNSPIAKVVILDGIDENKLANVDVPIHAFEQMQNGDIIKVFSLANEQGPVDPDLKSFDDPTKTYTNQEQYSTNQNETLVYGFNDFDRSTQTWIILILWFIIILIVARLKGFAAIYGLVVSCLLVVYFTIPSIFSGANPILLGFVTASLIMFFVQFFAHGFNMKTVTALLGTIFGLLISTTIGYFVVMSMRIYTLPDENASYLIYSNSNVAIYTLVISSMIISAVGALNDTTVTQASAVKELQDLDNKMSNLELYKRAMRIGRDHIASTIYTIALVYIATLFPTIMQMMDYGFGFFDAITSSNLITEIISVIASSIGLIIAVPLTTMIATLTMGSSNARKSDHSHISIDHKSEVQENKISIPVVKPTF